jgi:2-polyprenyl-3-methyl-5-hydroxy-6-metoxy-1,4-benzoquinol methylase
MNLENFYKTYREICLYGYSVIGRTRRTSETELSRWHFTQVLPPSQDAQWRFRFLKTLQIEKSNKPRRILEVATGGGFNAICLKEDYNEIIINDLLPLPKDFKDFVGSEKIRFIQKNLFELNHNECGYFDLIVNCEVIEHIAHGDQFIEKLKSLLSPGGKLLLTTPNGKYCRSKLPTFSQITDFSVFEKNQYKPDSDGHLYLYTPSEISTLLQKCGFENINVELFITPFISGHAGLRYLPKTKILFPIYYFADYLLRMVNKEFFCSQLIVTANI